jgi:hypothetical protein
MAILGMMSEVMMLEIRFTLWLSNICFPTHIQGFKLVGIISGIKCLLMQFNILQHSKILYIQEDPQRFLNLSHRLCLSLACRRVADTGCLSRLSDPDFYPSRIQDRGSRISDPGSRIQQQQQERKN